MAQQDVTADANPRDLRPTGQVVGIGRGAGPSLGRATIPQTPSQPVGFRRRTVLLTKTVMAAFLWAWNYAMYVFRWRYPFATYERVNQQAVDKLRKDDPNLTEAQAVDRLKSQGTYRTGIIPADDSMTIALAGDWGSGTKSALKVAALIDALKPDYKIHLGDVYYSGTDEEFKEWFLPLWQNGTKGRFTLNANHEMYSGGRGYFTALRERGEDFPLYIRDYFILLFRKLKLLRPPTPRTESQVVKHLENGKWVPQDVSYFCLENNHWRVLGIDTGYYSKTFPFLELVAPKLIKLHREMRKWLQKVVFAKDDDRPVILLSHHNWYSSYDSEYTRMAKGLSPLENDGESYIGRVLLWFWGHEHRFSGYAPHGLPVRQNIIARMFKEQPLETPEVRGRCIGHGGVPFDIGYPSRNRNLVFSDESLNYESTNAVKGKERLGNCGFAFLRFEGQRLEVSYYNETYDEKKIGQAGERPPLLKEVWTWDRQAGTWKGVVEEGEDLAVYEDIAVPYRGKERPDPPPEYVLDPAKRARRLQELGGEWRMPASSPGAQPALGQHLPRAATASEAMREQVPRARD